MSELLGAQELAREYVDVDLVPRMRREHLHSMLLTTTWTLPLLGFVALALTSNGQFNTIELWMMIPLVAISLASALGLYLLNNYQRLNWSVYVYVGGFLVGIAFLMLYGAERNLVYRHIAPFLLTLIVSTAGLFLTPTPALIVTGVSFIWTILFVFFSGTTSYDPMAFLIALAVTGVANMTAGSLYTTTEYSVHSYLKATERADEFWRNKEELRIALATQDWLNQQLKESNRVLEKRALQLQTSSQVSGQAASILELKTLLSKVVKLIQVRFGYYFVGIWLPDERGEAILLRAGACQSGDDLATHQLSIPLETPSIVVSVFRSGEHRLVNQVQQTLDYFPLAELPDTQAVLALPLHIGERTMGVLNIESHQINAFVEDDRMVLQTLADQLAIAIRNAELYASEQYRRQIAESMEQTGRVLSSSLDLHEVPGRILDQLAVLVPYVRGLFMVEQEGQLYSVAQRGFSEQDRAIGLVMPIRQGDVFQKLMSARAPVIIPDVTQDARFQQVAWLPLNYSWMGVPLITKDRVIGMISLTREAVDAFGPDDSQIVQTFAGQAAIALDNARLYDEITRFNEQLEQMVAERTEELNKAYQTLEKLDRNKSDFINVTAHELRTPLTVIRGYTQVLQSSPVLVKNLELKPLLDGILSGTQRLHGIVNSMLDIAKIDSATLSATKHSLDIGGLLEHLVLEFEPALLERRLTVILEGMATLPLVQADTDLLHKVFDNLLSNAIKYTPDGGSITITGQSLPDNLAPEAVEISVRDTGIGIVPEHLELIFEKFYQMGEVAVHSSGRTKFKGGGPGLGLAIARGIVEAHGGRLWAESSGCDEAVCPGSTFHVLLPVK